MAWFQPVLVMNILPHIHESIFDTVVGLITIEENVWGCGLSESLGNKKNRGKQIKTNMPKFKIISHNIFLYHKIYHFIPKQRKFSTALLKKSCYAFCFARNRFYRFI